LADGLIMATLYTTEILRLATQIPHLGRLPAQQDGPHGSADLRAPICGSRMIVDVILSPRGQVTSIGIEPHACALGQASAALMGRQAIGITASEVAALRAQLQGFLLGESDAPDFAIFGAARTHTARHGAILLPFDALAEAMAAALLSTDEIRL
jgi:NifU-like protein involved in Fe-S cluster formation